MSSPSRRAGNPFIGVWWLQSRVDTAADGTRREEPGLGSDPLGILTYTADRFAAQFMKRDRADSPEQSPGAARNNNTAAVGGYDAYFGTYRIDEATGEVIHKLDAALSPANVGIEVKRTLHVQDDQLVIELETSTASGEAVTRRLTWTRIG